MNVPYDVWLHVASFLPQWHLQNMFSVNHSWFNIAMDARYQEITVSIGDKKVERKLLRLREPLIGKRVRSLHFWPWFVVADPAKLRPSKLRAIANRLIHPNSSKSPTLIVDGLLPARARRQIQIIMDVFIHLPNVKEYHIDWAQNPPQQWIYYAPALTPLLQGLGPNLRSLSLMAPLSGLPPLLPSCRLGSLEVLELTLCADGSPNGNINLGVDSLAVFINNMPNLNSLLITSISHELQFFHRMGFFPQLRKFCLFIPFSFNYLLDTSGLRTFLNTHTRTLTHLSLKSTHHLPSEFSSPDWIEQSLSDIVFPNLRTLHVALRPRARLNTMIGHFHRFADTLSALALTDRFLSYDDLEQVLGARSHFPGSLRLEKLDIKVYSLSPELVDLLAEDLPRLRELELEYLHVTHKVGVKPYDTSSRGMFFDEMQKRRYVEWKLQHLDIRTTGYMYPLSQSIPSIRSFRVGGHFVPLATPPIFRGFLLSTSTRATPTTP